MNPENTLRQLGEDGFLELLRPTLRRHTEGLPLGTGDDVAITKGTPAGHRLVWTIDAMQENTHFRFWAGAPGAEWIGRKLAASNLSDLASKGAHPLFGLLSFGAPGGAPAHLIEEFYGGLDAELTEAGARLAGGDTFRADCWTLSLALVGTIPSDLPIAARTNAKVGQNIFVTGWPGRSGAGFQILEKNLLAGGLDEDARNALVEAHIRPKARLAAGQALTRELRDLAMLDVSDGVERDARRIATQSGVQLVLETGEFPIAREIVKASPQLGKAPGQMFLFGGEDYELLFTSMADTNRVRGVLEGAGVNLDVTRIGHVREGGGVVLRLPDGTERPPEKESYEHFS